MRKEKKKTLINRSIVFNCAKDVSAKCVASHAARVGGGGGGFNINMSSGMSCSVY